jgi:hypothetical protein
MTVYSLSDLPCKEHATYSIAIYIFYLKKKNMVNNSKKDTKKNIWTYKGKR